MALIAGTAPVSTHHHAVPQICLKYLFHYFLYCICLKCYHKRLYDIKELLDNQLHKKIERTELEKIKIHKNKQYSTEIVGWQVWCSPAFKEYLQTTKKKTLKINKHFPLIFKFSIHIFTK